MAASSALALPTSTLGSVIGGNRPRSGSKKPGGCLAAQPARLANWVRRMSALDMVDASLSSLYARGHRHEQFHLRLAADEERRALVQVGRVDVEDAAAAVGRLALGLLGQEGDRVGLVQKPELALGMGPGRRV